MFSFICHICTFPKVSLSTPAYLLPNLTKFCLKYKEVDQKLATLLRSSVQFNSATQLCPTLWSHGWQRIRPPCPSPTPEVCSNSLPLNQWCHQPPHPLSSPSPAAFNLSQYKGLFQWVNALYQVAKVLELQHQSFQWIFWFDFFWDWLVWYLCSPMDSHEYSPKPQFKNIMSSFFSLFYCPTLISIYDYWKNNTSNTCMNVCSKLMSLVFNTPSRFVIAFLPRSKHLFISWLQSPSTVILEPKQIMSVSVSIVSPSICHGFRWQMWLDAMILIFWITNV